MKRKNYDGSENLERADLNKCPDCGCFFAGENCPLCGKPCPEEMKAGKRAPEKAKPAARKYSRARNVEFVSWYHSWWFIILMLILMPIVGIVLLATSPHKRGHKIIAFIICAIWAVGSYFGIGSMIVDKITGLLDPPVNTRLTREEYVDACAEITPIELYRSAESYDEKFISVNLTVIDRIASYEAYWSNDDYVTYYVCKAPEGGDYTILVRDCVLDDSQNFLSGDVITVYGEGDGNITVHDMDYNAYTAPCINMAYFELVK